jgi:hypothetical protein
MNYHHISIESIAKESKHIIGNWKDQIGSCGYCRDAVYYTAIRLGVPPSCIKLCQSRELINHTAHAFIIIILDQPYLIDFSFGQFLCMWEQDRESVLVNELYPHFSDFIEKGYAPLTERFLIVFYTMITRFCLDPSQNKPLDMVQLTLTKPYKEDKVNFLELTLSHEWLTELDYDEEEAKKYGWI